MKLYHGSHANALSKIKVNGIQPRALSKGRNNWDHTVTSNRNAVYLTDAYPWHFAHAAARDKEHGLILEIDRDRLLPWQLCPDEDFMEQATRKIEQPNFAPTDWSMKKRTLHYRKIAQYNASLADVSLEHMGTAAYYGTISWSAVTRYVLIDWNKLSPTLFMMAVDSMVSIMNYRVLQHRHRAFTRWFFEEDVAADDLIGLGPDVTLPYMKERNEHFAKAIANREGLTVVDKNLT